MLPVNTSVQEVLSAVVKPGADYVLVKMNSMGGGVHDAAYKHLAQQGTAWNTYVFRFCSYHNLAIHCFA